MIIDLCGPHQTKIERKAFGDGCIEGNAADAQWLLWGWAMFRVFEIEKKFQNGFFP